MGGIKLPPGFGNVDILSVVRSDLYRIGSTPFGAQPMNYYIGKAVPWKGFKKNKDESTSDYLDRLKKVNPRVAAGLKNAIAMGYKGETGVVIAKVNGVRKKMPRYSYELAKKGKRANMVGEIEASGESAGAVRLIPSA